MSYVRVWVIESPIPWSQGMKLFKKEMEPALKAQKKAGLLTFCCFGERFELQTDARLRSQALTFARVKIERRFRRQRSP